MHELSRSTGRSLAACHAAAAAADELHSAAGQRQLADWDVSLIIDMDDTLISNQILFARAEEALAGVYADLDSSGRDPETLRAAFLEIDAANVPAMGYTPARWRHSARQAGEEFAGRTLTDEEAQRVSDAAEIAMGVGDILAGCENALAALNRAGKPMLLKTKGCRDKQTEKLAAHRFDRYFGDHISIVDRKDDQSFLDAVASRGFNGRVLSIGDSEKSDIVPAIRAGYEGIHIAGGPATWSFEAVDGLQVRKAPSFPEALLLGLRSDTNRI